MSNLHISSNDYNFLRSVGRRMRETWPLFIFPGSGRLSSASTMNYTNIPRKECKEKIDLKLTCTPAVDKQLIASWYIAACSMYVCSSLVRCSCKARLASINIEISTTYIISVQSYMWNEKKATKCTCFWAVYKKRQPLLYWIETMCQCQGDFFLEDGP